MIRIPGKSALIMLAVALFGLRPAAASEAGVAAVNIEPPVGIPLAGYGAKARRMPGYLDWGNKHDGATFFRPSEGVHSPIRAKSMVIRNSDELLVFVSVDFVGVEQAMVADLAARLAHLGVSEDRLVVGATHTHSGPGTITRRWSLAIVAVDRFYEEHYEYIVAKIVESVEQAHSQLESAELLTGSFQTQGLQRNKFRRIGEGHFDNTARLLLARSQANGQLLGGIVNYAQHGNGMPISDLRYSSDVPGQYELNMEKLIAERNVDNHYPPVVLFMNGASGDVGNPVRTVEATEADGVEFARQAMASGVLGRLRRVEPMISVSRAKVELGWAGYSLKNCIFKPKEGKSTTAGDPRVPLPLMQNETFVSVINIGDLRILTWPGELSTQVGYNTRAIAAKHGIEDAWIFGLTNDYQSYFTTESEYREAKYDSCSSLFRWHGAEKIQEVLTSLIERGTNHGPRSAY